MIASYLLLLGWLVDFRLSSFVDVRELLVLIAGTIVLVIAEHLEGKRGGLAVVRSSLKTTGMLSTLVLLLSVPASVGGGEEASLRLMEAGRPLALSLLIAGLLDRPTGGSTIGRSELAWSGGCVRADAPECFRARLLEAGISARELQICEYAANGRTNAEIAAELHVAESTVKKHLQNAFRKLGISRREEMMRLYHAPP